MNIPGIPFDMHMLFFIIYPLVFFVALTFIVFFILKRSRLNQKILEANIIKRIRNFAQRYNILKYIEISYIIFLIIALSLLAYSFYETNIIGTSNIRSYSPYIVLITIIYSVIFWLLKGK